MDEISIGRKKNLIQARSFEDLLDKAIKAYSNRSVDAAEIIQHLIDFAKKMLEEQEGDRNYFVYASTRSRAVIMPTTFSSLTIGNRLICFTAIVAAVL